MGDKGLVGIPTGDSGTGEAVQWKTAGSIYANRVPNCPSLPRTMGFLGCRTSVLNTGKYDANGKELVTAAGIKPRRVCSGNVLLTAQNPYSLPCCQQHPKLSLEAAPPP